MNRHTTRLAGISTAAIIIIALFYFLFFGGKNEKIVIASPDTISALGTAHIIKAIIEKYYDASVEIKSDPSFDNSYIFEELDKGTFHIHPEVRLPNQNNLRELYVENKKTIVETPNEVKIFQGLCVSKQTSIKYGIEYVKELSNIETARLFDSDGNGKGEIWIQDIDGHTTNIEKIRAKSYGYYPYFEFIEGGEEIFFKISEELEEKKPILFRCYTPHYLWQKYEPQALKEPAYEENEWNIILPEEDSDWFEKSYAKTAWQESRLFIYYSKSLESKRPDVALLLNKVRFKERDKSKLINAIEIKQESYEEFALKWIEDNSYLIEKWIN